ERSCPKPRSWRLRAGGSANVDLGPVISQCRFQLRRDATPVTVELRDALCQFEIRPSLTEDGRTRLQLVPRIQHSFQDRKRALTTSAEWLKRMEKPTEIYEFLGCEVCLAPNEYLIVGARGDRVESMGYQFFMRPMEAPPVQRLLVVRTSRVLP